MKRSELYTLIWSKPMVHAAKELGISDVGLAKACRRNAVPVPQRGHWNKLQAGKPSPQIPLPQPEIDPLVSFATTDPAKREPEQQAARERQAAVVARVHRIRSERPEPGTVRERAHPLIKATTTYCERIPRLIARYKRMSPMARISETYERPPGDDNGRWHIDAPNGLIMTISKSSLAWALEIHDRAFKALVRAGAQVQRLAGKDREPSTIVCILRGEQAMLSFKEGYRRNEIDADELAKLRARDGWAQKYRYEPSGKFTWAITGTERSLARQWVGTRAQIEARLDEIVATCLDFLELQPAKRRERQSAEELRRMEVERAERRRLVAASRAEQLKNAFLAAEEFDRVDSLKRFLKVVEAELPDYREPYRERAKVWLSVVQEELARANPYEKIISECLTLPAWRTWPPAWWPPHCEQDALDCQEGDNER
jgi:hypothetical protein